MDHQSVGGSGSKVTAVGRILRPKHGEPRRHHVIRVGADGKARTVVKRDLPVVEG
jgi:hypothetical protein